MTIRCLLQAALLLATTQQMLPAEPIAGSTGGNDPAVKELLAALETANNSGDVDKWVGLFAEDFVYMAPGMPAVTQRAELAEVARAGFRNKAAVAIDLLEVETCGAWAFARAAVTGTVKLHTSGEDVVVDVKELLVLTRGPQGTWRIARLMSNSNS